MNNLIKTIEKVTSKAESLNKQEALSLYMYLPLTQLMHLAHSIRKEKHPNNHVTYIIDRNVNITNVCFSFCEFCNFCTTENSKNAYVTTMEQYTQKINELFEFGGNQLLLQGGMHPHLGLDYYTKLFQELKRKFPKLYLHALSPSEIIFLSQKEKKSISHILSVLTQAGLDSLPGGGAEILSDRVRQIISPLKANKQQWLDVMREAHKLGISTSATMMFGHIETLEERIEHLFLIRDLQNEHTRKGTGFISFIPWTFQSGNTRLAKHYSNNFHVSATDYIRLLAISRIVLHNIPNIQASWLTVGKDTAMLALHAGANDLGSIMLEENVVASTGVLGKLSVEQMEKMITRSGFIPKKRNQRFEIVNL